MFFKENIIIILFLREKERKREKKENKEREGRINILEVKNISLVKKEKRVD
jgi:hypothetical protein